MKTPQSLIDYLQKQTQERGNSPALQFYAGGRWEQWTWAEYSQRIDQLALALLELGVKPKDSVAIYASNRLEWAIFDFACQSIQAVVVPIYPTIAIDELEAILEDAKPKFMVLESGLPARQIRLVQPRFACIQKVITLDTMPEAQSLREDWVLWRDLPAGEKYLSALKELTQSIRRDTLATIVYTSGTSGTPKGVLLNHEQILSEVIESFTAVGVESSDVSLSILPYSHILGRIEIWGHLFAGFNLAFGRSIEKAREDLASIRPTIMVAVPRVFEKFHSLILSQIQSSQWKGWLADWALSIGFRVAAKRSRRQPLSLSLISGSLLADQVFLKQIKKVFGGRLRFAICGGAPLDPQVARFFHACDVLLLEGYGLTETTGAICVNTPSDYEFGTVGKPLPDVELMFAEDGEILIRSKKVGKAYHQNPEATQETFRRKIDGKDWFATGDIGLLNESGRLKITDRKKDLIKTAGGKYIAPQKVEAVLQNHSLISNVLIHGDRRKYIVALITLNKDEALRIAKSKELKYQDFASLTQHPEMLKLVRTIVADCNSKLSNFETIKKFSVLKEDFSVESGELTPSLKIRRKFVDQKFQTQLDELYR